MKKAIIFDLDDTVIKTQELYTKAAEAFCTQVSAVHGFERLDMLPLLWARHLSNKQYDWAEHGFPASLIEAYLLWCEQHDQAYTPLLAAVGAQLGYSVYGQTAEPLEHAGPVLAELCHTHRLYLYTLGQPAVQRKRIQDFPYTCLFTDVGNPARKDADTLRDFLRIHRLTAATTVYVGNSLRSDIQPAVTVGLTAIHLDVPTWAYDDATVDGAYYTVKSLREIPALLEKLEKAAVLA